MGHIGRVRFPLLGIALVALLCALWGGLLRLGWSWPLLHPPLPMAHGPLMVGGFLGTLICVERAVALNRRWTYAAPICTAGGAVLLMVGGAGWFGPLLLTLGSALLVAVFVTIVRQQPALFTAVLTLGAASWLVGNTLWLIGWSIPQVVYWWLSFLVVTIVGERLELSRLLRMTRWRYGTFFLALGLFMSGVLLTSIAFDAGVRLSGVGMLALALWLSRYDIARRTVRKAGLTRFIAVALLVGYVWLGIGGLLAIMFGGVQGGPAYDALLHAVFVGFVISMIFGHAPVIFPAVLRVPLAYDRSCYGPLVVLHASLIIRVGGDVVEWFALRRVGGMLNGIALMLFLANMVRLARRGRADSVLTRSARTVPEARPTGAAGFHH